MLEPKQMNIEKKTITEVSFWISYFWPGNAISSVPL
jgi:hypothetical protein